MSKTTLVILAVLFAAVAAGLGFFWPFGSGSRVVRLPGNVEIQEVRLGSKVGERVKEVHVKEGDIVEAGKPLVTFDVPELEAQRDQLKAHLQAAQAELAKITNGPRKFEIAAAKASADAVKAKWDRLEFGWREEEKRQATNEWESADAERKQAEDDFSRVAQLYQQRAASRAEYESALAVRDRARGRANAARAKHEMLQAGNRPEDKAEAKAEWQRALAKYEELKAVTKHDIDLAQAKVTEAKAKLAEIEVNIGEAVIRAPARARVEVLAVRKGDLVQPRQPVVRILYSDDLWINVYIPETLMGKVREDQTVEVSIDAFPNKRFQGTIRTINSISEFVPRNVQSRDERRYQVFRAKVRVDNTEGVFMAGMAAEVTIPLLPAPETSSR